VRIIGWTIASTGDTATLQSAWMWETRDEAAAAADAEMRAKQSIGCDTPVVPVAVCTTD